MEAKSWKRSGRSALWREINFLFGVNGHVFQHGGSCWTDKTSRRGNTLDFLRYFHAFFYEIHEFRCLLMLWIDKQSML